MRKNYDEILNKKFGRLSIIKILDNSEGRRKCICKCDCGKEIETQVKSILNGNTKSCGCLQKEATSQARSCNLQGEKFGRLVVIKRVNKENNKKAVSWLCKCECGNERIVISENLNNGNTKSCGCLWMERANGIHYSERNNDLDCFRPILANLHSSRGRKKGFDLDLNYLKELWDKQKGICPFLGIDLIPLGWDGVSDPIYTASIDRIDSSKGYVKGNIIFVSVMINYAKNKFEIEKLIDFLKLAGKMWSSEDKNGNNIQNISRFVALRTPN
jgi:hypothetical protein